MNGVIYARYSCDKQTENSILGQIRECNLFAEKNNIKVTNVYKDEAISGRTAEKRPAFMKMIKDAQMHFFDCIIVWKGDRFSRSRADAAKYKSELKKLGIKVLSATEANVTGPEAILMDGINEAFAEYFSVELAAKVERGMTQNTIDGKFNGGKLPLGYKKDGTKVVIDPETAPIIKEMFEMFANSCCTQLDVVNECKRKGYRNNNGSALSLSTVNRIFHNEKYIGHYEFKGTVNDNIYPPIISKEIFNKALEKCRVHSKNSQVYKSRTCYLLSKKLYCGECYSLMNGVYGKSKTGKIHYYYQCKNKNCNISSIHKNLIENTVLEYIINFIFDNKKIEELVKTVANHAKNSSPNIHLYEKELHNIDIKIDNIMKVIENGGDPVLLAKRINELKEERTKQLETIENYKKLNRVLSPMQIKNFLNSLKLKDYIEEKDKKYLIETLVDSVYYFENGTIKIFLNYCNEYCDKKNNNRSNNKHILYLSKEPYIDTNVFGATINLKTLN